MDGGLKRGGEGGECVFVAGLSLVMSQKRPAIKQGLCQKRVSFFSLIGGVWQKGVGGGTDRERGCTHITVSVSVRNQYGRVCSDLEVKRRVGWGEGSHVFQFVRKLTDFDLEFLAVLT